MVARYYTPELANRALPLVRAIARDVRATALEYRAALKALDPPLPDREREVLAERALAVQARLGALIEELRQLGVELKDPFEGLLDFRAKRRGRVVYLCWRLGEDRVGHWHELSAGFAGRRRIESF